MTMTMTTTTIDDDDDYYYYYHYYYYYDNIIILYISVLVLKYFVINLMTVRRFSVIAIFITYTILFNYHLYRDLQKRATLNLELRLDCPSSMGIQTSCGTLMWQVVRLPVQVRPINRLIDSNQITFSTTSMWGFKFEINFKRTV